MSKYSNDTRIETVRSTAKQYFQNTPCSHDWSHVQRVVQMCLYMGSETGADLVILELAALLHDIARREEDDSHGQVCHGQRGAELAEPLLRQLGYDDEIISQVTHCIFAHRFRNRKHAGSLEAKILFDADNLDAIGAIGIARCFAYAGENRLSLYTNNHLDLDPTTISPSLINYQTHTPVLEFKSKLLKVKEAMQTDIGKELAESRHQYIVDYLAQFTKEIKGLPVLI